MKVTEVTVRSPFITYFCQNPRVFLDIEESIKWKELKSQMVEKAANQFDKN